MTARQLIITAGRSILKIKADYFLIVSIARASIYFRLPSQGKTENNYNNKMLLNMCLKDTQLCSLCRLALQKRNINGKFNLPLYLKSSFIGRKRG
jgi:hypothetical protein